MHDGCGTITLSTRATLPRISHETMSSPTFDLCVMTMLKLTRKTKAWARNFCSACNKFPFEQRRSILPAKCSTTCGNATLSTQIKQGIIRQHQFRFACDGYIENSLERTCGTATFNSAVCHRISKHGIDIEWTCTTRLAISFFHSSNTNPYFSWGNVDINFVLYAVAILKTHSEDVGRAMFAACASSSSDTTDRYNPVLHDTFGINVFSIRATKTKNYPGEMSTSTSTCMRWPH